MSSGDSTRAIANGPEVVPIHFGIHLASSATSWTPWPPGSPFCRRPPAALRHSLHCRSAQHQTMSNSDLLLWLASMLLAAGVAAAAIVLYALRRATRGHHQRPIVSPVERAGCTGRAGD